MVPTIPVFPGGAFTGTSIVIVRETDPEPEGFGTTPTPVMCQIAFSTPLTATVGAPAVQVMPDGHSRMLDHVMHVDTGEFVHAALLAGDFCEPLAAHKAIAVSVVVLSCGWPVES